MIEWLTVEGWPSYEVSNDGRVRSIVKRNRWPPKELRGGMASNGYLTVVLCDDGRQQSSCIHVLVAAAFLGPRPSDEHEVAHNDGIHTNNHASNLRWATHAENVADTKRHGTFWIGENHGQAKLTDEAVLEMRRRVADGERIKTVAAEYGVSKQVARCAVRGITWKHLDGAVRSNRRSRSFVRAGGRELAGVRIFQEKKAAIR